MDATTDRPGLVPACPRGHVAVAVTRGTGLRRVCPRCLGEALDGLLTREVSVNDYLTRLEADGPTPLPAQDAKAAQMLAAAAGELHGDTSPRALRKVVREVAAAAGVPTTEVMKWPLRKLAAGGLEKLRQQLAAA